MIERTIEKSNTVAHALEWWSLSNVATLIDAVADGEPPKGKTFAGLRDAARLDVRMMPRLIKLAEAILEKYDRGELTQAEAAKLSGSEGEL